MLYFTVYIYIYIFFFFFLFLYLALPYNIMFIMNLVIFDFVCPACFPFMFLV